jgi:hypothetical protein
MTKEERLLQQNEMLEHMLRVFTVSLNTIHEKDHLNGGTRMMLASMGRATLTNNEQFKESL